MKRAHSEAGQTELVIVFPVALLVILLLVQGALWFLARSVADDAARDGARAVAVVGGSPSGGVAVTTHDLGQLAGPMLTDTSVSATRSATDARVTVTGHAESIFPGWSLFVTASASEPTEQFRP